MTRTMACGLIGHRISAHGSLIPPVNCFPFPSSGFLAQSPNVKLPREVTGPIDARAEMLSRWRDPLKRAL